MTPKPITDLFPGALSVVAIRGETGFEKVDIWLGEQAFLATPTSDPVFQENGQVDPSRVLNRWPAEEVYLLPTTTCRRGVILFTDADGAALVIREKTGRMLCVTEPRCLYSDQHVGCRNGEIERVANIALYPDVLEKKFEILLEDSLLDKPLSKEVVFAAKQFVLNIWKAAMEAGVPWSDPLIGGDDGDVCITWEDSHWYLSLYVEEGSSGVDYLLAADIPGHAEEREGKAPADDMETWLDLLRWVEGMQTRNRK